MLDGGYRQGRSPSSLSSVGSISCEAASGKSVVMTQILNIISAPREAGGCGGALRYWDLTALLPTLGCQWGVEQVEDCWYDIVRGQPVGVASDMAWAARCIYEHLQGEIIEVAKQESPPCFSVSPSSVSVMPLSSYCWNNRGKGCDEEKEKEEKSEEEYNNREKKNKRKESPPPPLTHNGVKNIVVVKSVHKSKEYKIPSQQSFLVVEPSTSATSSSPITIATTIVPPSPSPPPEKQHQQQKDHLSSEKRSHSPGNGRFASPTMSSIRRSRSAAEKPLCSSLGCKRNTIVGTSPKRERSPTRDNEEVFRRLIEDANKRRKRASTPPPVATTAKTTTTLTKNGSRSSSPNLNHRRLSPNGKQQWNKPTKSYAAKLSPEPPPLDPLEAAASTPLVERHAPQGPSTYVPSGYVEAVARLRRYAASRNHYQFIDSLRTQTPTPVIEERSPILRLPVPGGSEGKIIVDVRLASPIRCQNLLIPRDVPYDDPSRVIIQNFIQERRLRCRQ